MKSLYPKLFISLLLIAASVLVFARLTHYQFLNYDDNYYITGNPMVLAGLTWRGIVWAFTTVTVGFWHPLTWLSHMLDVELFGLKPGLHHLTGLLWHIANGVLLFWLLSKVTGSLWKSAAVAFLFLIHPLHVESVAWIAERKDTLSAFFWILTIWAYVRYTELRSFKSYGLVLLCFALGLMAKPMLITLPFVLLLLDAWPLERFRWAEKKSAAGLVVEKAPLFLMTGFAAGLAFFAEKSGGALPSFDQSPLGTRIANALVSYAAYIGKTVWPADLITPYPFPESIPAIQIGGACILLIGVSAVVIRFFSTRPYLLVGWLWYLGTLVPVIGLVQVGSHGMADRYTYIPLIGLFFAAVWGLDAATARWKYRKIFLLSCAGVVFTAFSAISWIQAGYWENSVKLFRHTLQVSPKNAHAQNNFGTMLLASGQTEEAMLHFSEALKLEPYNAKFRYNLGRSLYRQGKIKEAFALYQDALKINPKYFPALKDSGQILLEHGQVEKAIQYLSEALKTSPDKNQTVEIHTMLGDAFVRRGKLMDAISHYSEALRIQPNYSNHYNLGVTFLISGRLEEAIAHFTQSLQMKPDNAWAHNNLANALARRGQTNEALIHYTEALRIDPKFVEAHKNREIVLKKAHNGVQMIDKAMMGQVKK